MVADDKRSRGPSLDVPDLDVPRPRTAAPARAPAAAPSPMDDDDPLGMEIQRDMSQPFAPPAPSPPASARGGGGVALSDAPRGAKASGLDVEYNRLAPRPKEVPTGPGTLATVLGPLGAVVLAGGAFAGLLRLVHRPAGLSVTALLPSAYDGSSAVASGAVAIGSLVGAVALGYVGVRASSRSWLLVGSAALVMLLALAMVTVTLASSGEHGPPPDGALLVPWLAPFATLLGGLDLVLRGARRLLHEEGGARAAGAPIALVGGALVFLAVETSRFAHLLPRI